MSIFGSIFGVSSGGSGPAGGHGDTISFARGRFTLGKTLTVDNFGPWSALVPNSNTLFVANVLGRIGTLSGLIVLQDIRSGSSVVSDLTYTIMINGSPTLLAVTLNENDGTPGINNIDTVAIVPGDVLSMRVTKNVTMGNTISFSSAVNFD